MGAGVRSGCGTEYGWAERLSLALGFAQGLDFKMRGNSGSQNWQVPDAKGSSKQSYMGEDCISR